MIYNSVYKIIVLLLIVSLNWTGISAIGQTVAYYNDTETSSENSFSAGTLDFSLPPAPDFSPKVAPTQNSIRDINVLKDGVLDFEYNLRTESETGNLCDYLNLTITRDGADIGYTGTLKDFTYNAGQFSDPGQWQFTANLTSNDAALQNQACNFDFVFDGTQIGGAGFYDQEIIPNTITSGQWVIPPPPPPSDACIKINEVYYHVGPMHGSEPANEWVEIYNPTNSAVDISGWRITDNSGWERTFCVFPSTCFLTSIPAYGFAVVTPATSTWDYWPGIPSEAVKIVLGISIGNGLANTGTGDRVILRNADGVEIDAVSWGSDDYAFGAGNGVSPATGVGHSIARKTKGVDTNSPDDWEKLINPNPGTNPHLTSGEEIITEEFVISEEGVEGELVEATTEEETSEETIIDEEVNTGEEQLGNGSLPVEETSEEEPAVEEETIDLPEDDNLNQNNDGGDNGEGDSDGGDNPNELTEE